MLKTVEKVNNFLYIRPPIEWFWFFFNLGEIWKSIEMCLQGLHYFSTLVANNLFVDSFPGLLEIFKLRMSWILKVKRIFRWLNFTKLYFTEPLWFHRKDNKMSHAIFFLRPWEAESIHNLAGRVEQVFGHFNSLDTIIQQQRVLIIKITPIQTTSSSGKSSFVFLFLVGASSSVSVSNP